MTGIHIISVIGAGATFTAESLRAYVALLADYAGEASSFQVAIATGDPEVESMAGAELRVHTPDVLRAEMFNQLAAQSSSAEILFLDGPVLPSTAPPTFALQEADWAQLEGRRLTVPPPSEDGYFSLSVMENADFNRDVHDASPIAIRMTRDCFLHLRGFDERASRGNSLFMDLVWRLRRAAGFHEASVDTEAYDVGSAFPGLRGTPWETGRKAREQEKAAVCSDLSLYRNLTVWSVPVELRPTLVTVSIATRDRAAYLGDAIRSVLSQDFHEFELIVVDDGSADETPLVVSAFDDPRIRYVQLPPTGISHARNHAADLAKGHFTAVHDDDDIMLPWRLSAGLAALDGEHDASYGSWVNFDDETAQLTLHLTPIGFGHHLVAHNGQTPGHATWLLPTEWVRSIRYDETLPSAIDHNLAIRTVLSGVRWKHTQKVHYLRRLHSMQVSQVDARRQMSSALLSRFFATFPSTFAGRNAMASEGKALRYPQTIDRKSLFRNYGAYLPDHLVERGARLNGLVGKKVLALELHDRFDMIGAEVDLVTGRTAAEIGGVGQITWRDIVAISQSGLQGAEYYARPRKDAADADRSATDPDTWLQERIAWNLRQVTNKYPRGAIVVIEGEVPPDDLSPEGRDGEWPVVAVRSLSVNYGDMERQGWSIVGFRNVAEALSFHASGVAGGRQFHVFAPKGTDLAAASTGVTRRAD